MVSRPCTESILYSLRRATYRTRKRQGVRRGPGDDEAAVIVADGRSEDSGRGMFVDRPPVEQRIDQLVPGMLYRPGHRAGAERRLRMSTRRDLLAQKGYFSISDCIVTHCRSQNVSRLTVDPKCPPDPEDLTPPNGATASSSTV
jgi:hypothetical protein